MAKAVKWDLVADPTKFQRGFKDAEKSTGRLRGALGHVNTSLGKLDKVALAAGAAVGAGLLAAGAKALDFAKDSVQLATTFDKTMRQVASVTGVPAKKFGELRKLALDMGSATSFSAREAGDAMLELAKGGLTAAQIKGGALKSTLTLAAAGSLELGDAATTMSNALNMFALKAKDSGKVAAALAGGANASTASVESLAQALSQVGPGARNAGLGLNETVGVLAAFDQAGIKGSDAGTSLKTMLTSLVPQTSKAATAMKRLGLDFTDAHGAIVPITEVAQQLQDKLSKLSESQRISALQTIFGSDATRAATVLMHEGRKGIDKYVTATKDMGAAEELAKTNTSGAAGAFERLQGAVETTKIKLGTLLLPKLAEFATWVSDKGIPRVEDFATKLKDGLGKELGRMKKAWDDNKASFQSLLDLFKSSDEQMDGTASTAKTLADAYVWITTTAGDAARAIHGIDTALAVTNEAMKASGEWVYTHFTRPVEQAFAGLGKRALDVMAGMVTAAKITAEALHLPMAGALAKAEKNINEFRASYNKAIGGLHDKHTSITADFGWKGLSVFRTKSGKAMFASGGAITEGSGPTADDVPLWGSKGEHIWTAREVTAAGGHDAMKRWRAAVLRGDVPGYARGGAVGGGIHPTVTLPSTRELGTKLGQFNAGIERVLNLATAAFKNTLAAGGGAGPNIPHAPGSWQMATSFLRGLGIPFNIVSTFRPGARTHASGRQSYHALNRAVDLDGPNKLAIWSALTRTHPTELIYSRAPYYMARGGRRPIGRLDPITRADHYSHVHAAYDQGGYLPTGASVALNNTGKPERVLGPREQLVDYDRLAAAVAKALAAQGVGAVSLDGRQLRTGLRNSQRREGVPPAQQVR